MTATETQTTFDLFQTAIKAAEAHRDKIKALKPNEVTSEMYAEGDRILDEVTDLRMKVDQERQIASLELAAAQHGDWNDIASWVQARGLIPVDGPGETLPDTGADLVQAAFDVHNGKASNVQIRADLGPAFQRNQLMQAGVNGRDMLNAAMQGGTLVVNDEGAVVRAAISRSSGLTADEFSTSFYDYAEYLGGLRRAGAFVTQHARGNQQKFFKNVAHNLDAGATVEGVAAAATEDSYGEYTIDFANYTALAYISKEAMQDAIPSGIMGIINDGLSRVLVRKSETAYHAKYLAYDSTSAATIALSYDRTEKGSGDSTVGNPKVSLNNILDTLYGLDATYLSMPGIAWLCQPMTYRHILGLTYGGQRPTRVYEPNPVLGAPDVIEGRPVILDAFYPAIVVASAGGADQPSLSIGNYQDAFHIADATMLSLSVSQEYKFAEQQLTVLGSFRTGSAIRDTRAARLVVSDGDSS